MTEQIQDGSLIKNFLDIAALSKRNVFFTPTGDKESIPGLLKYKGETEVLYELQTMTNLDEVEGFLTIRVLSFQYQFPVELRKKEKKVYLFYFPKAIFKKDLRLYPRLRNLPGPECVFQIWGIGTSRPIPDGSKVSLLNLSASGMAFEFKTLGIHKGDRLTIRGTVFGKPFEVAALIHGASLRTARCEFLTLDPRLKKYLETEIAKRLDEALDTRLNTLKASRMIADDMEKMRSDFDVGQDLDELILPFISPLIRSTLSVFTSFFGLAPIRESIKVETISSGIYDISAEMSATGENFKSIVFLGMEEPLLKYLGHILFEDNRDDHEIMDLPGEIINMILGNAKKFMGTLGNYQMGTPTVVRGREHVLAVLFRYRVLRVRFLFEGMPFDLNVCIRSGRNKIENTRKTQFLFDKNLIVPLQNSVQAILGNFLKLNPRKMSVSVKEKYLARFETSALINLFSDQVQGKILFNTSEKLAFKLYELLLGEQVNEMNEAVKDALSEIVNMITGNAKEEFSREGLAYQLSIPYVIRGRKHIITIAGKAPFISALYNTDHGFFELCFTLLSKD